MRKEIIKDDHKWIIKTGRISSSGETLYDVEFYEYYDSIKSWRLLSVDRNYTKEAIEFEFGIKL